MHKQATLSLLAALFVTVAVVGVGATDTAAPAAAAPALAADVTPGPACTETTGALLAEIAPQPSAAEPAETLTADFAWRARCYPSCMPCSSDYDCPWGETCQVFQTCP